MSIQGLSTAIKSSLENQVAQQARAMRGTIKNGKFISGSRTYPFIQAVDCNTHEGRKVWAQLSNDGRAVLIGE